MAAPTIGSTLISMKRLLFVTRKFPPSIGGMQRVSFELHRALERLCPVTLVAMGRSQRFLPFFAPIALAKTMASLRGGSRCDAVLLGDGVLAPLAAAAKKSSPRVVEVSCILHGLDLTYPNPAYQWILRRSLPFVDRFICVSEGTLAIAVERGVPRERSSVIHWGVAEDRASSLTRSEARRLLAQETGTDWTTNKLLLSVGRLVRRKGVVWFLEEVFPKVLSEHPDTRLLVVGQGGEEARIRRVIEDRYAREALLAPNVSDASLPHYYRASDLFIMPNIVVEGDVEGFGIVALEAALNGLWSIGTNVAGVNEAIVERETGTLAPPFGAVQFASAVSSRLSDIERLHIDGARAAAHVKRHMSWAEVALRYLSTLGSFD